MMAALSPGWAALVGYVIGALSACAIIAGLVHSGVL